jgi:hypothetical protein
MEAYESFVALALESENYVVGGPYYFRPSAEIRKQYGLQNSSFEVDIVAARKDRLVLVTVKSFFGSDGVKAHEVWGEGRGASGYKMLNRPEVTETIIGEACTRFGYAREQVEFRLYVGKFQNPNQEVKTREWAVSQVYGGGPLLVFKAEEVLDQVQVLAQHTSYIDNPTLVAVKVMNHVEAAKAKAKISETKSKKSTLAARFPVAVGSLVRCSKDGFTGYVTGYSMQKTSEPYLKVFSPEQNVTMVRSVNTVEVIRESELDV